MEYFNYDFPVNGLMTGSVIPGVRMPLAPSQIRTYEDHTSYVVRGVLPQLDKTIRATRARVDHIVRYPSMHGEHTKGHGVLERLKELLGHKDQKPQTAPGFEPVAENRMWRNFGTS